jgi:8-oxo-dGTP pyrophosphatase MutT (NUDIX family)
MSSYARVLSISQASSLLKRCDETNDCGSVQKVIEFKIGNDSYGSFQPNFADILLKKYSHVFCKVNGSIRLQPDLENGTPEERTRVVGTVNDELKEDGTIKGWRNELLPVACSFNAEPAFLIERAACAYFGIRAYGVHVVGYERNDASDPSAVTHLWVGTRSSKKQTYPGALDHIVAGGISYGISPYQCVIKECEEEASIPKALAHHAHSVGSLSYRSMDEFGQIRNDIIFAYDLDLTSSGFQPIPADGEVESFALRDIDWVINTLCDSKPRYKPKCNLVVIDFLIRHGIISAESPQYLEINAKLRTMPLL